MKTFFIDSSQCLNSLSDTKVVTERAPHKFDIEQLTGLKKWDIVGALSSQMC